MGYCGKCGREMQRVVLGTREYCRNTGEKLFKLLWRCSSRLPFHDRRFERVSGYPISVEKRYTKEQLENEEE